MADASTVSRRVGITLIAGLATVLVFARVVQSQHDNTSGIEHGLRALDDVDHAAKDDRPELLAKAEHAFGAATGAVVVEPMAILGLEVTEEMGRSLRKPLPKKPDPAGITELDAERYAQACLARAKPDEALAYLNDPDVRRRVGRSLAVVEHFAELWVRVRTQPADK